MGLFDVFRCPANKAQTNGLTAEERELLRKLQRLEASGNTISPELYQQLRDFQVAWLERNYDFSTLEGILAIPETHTPPGAPFDVGPMKSRTGEVYYYLRHKAYKYEEVGQMDLALACMRKSVALVRYMPSSSPDDYYPLVKMLARAGFKEDAYQIKEAIDTTYTKCMSALLKNSESSRIENSYTDLVIMDVRGSVCPECAKYQGRVYSISGKNKLFPKVPDFYHHGSVHPGCGHMFWSYIHGVSDPQLDYTLSVHPLQDPRYGRDIVTFSNRPFVDDRTDECKQAAEEARAELTARLVKEQEYRENMIEIEFRRGQEARDFKWLQSNIPQKCPKSLSGFRRMKTQNTKNYQLLQKEAADLGRKI